MAHSPLPGHHMYAGLECDTIGLWAKGKLGKQVRRVLVADQTRHLQVLPKDQCLVIYLDGPGALCRLFLCDLLREGLDPLKGGRGLFPRNFRVFFRDEKRQSIVDGSSLLANQITVIWLQPLQQLLQLADACIECRSWFMLLSTKNYACLLHRCMFPSKLFRVA